MSSKPSILYLPPGGEPPPPRPRELYLDRLEVLGSFGPFDDGLPEGWKPQIDGTWETRDGSLYGRVDNEKAAFLRWETEIEGNHAIRYRGAAIRHEGETAGDVATNGNLNCVWDYRGDYDENHYLLSLSGLGGWYDGLCGIEILDDKLGATIRAVSNPMTLEADRTYDVVAGRFDETQFVFVDAKLVAAVEVAPSFVLTRASDLRRSLSRVAVATWGRPGGSEVRFESIVVYHIPDRAVC